jgi:P-type Ca2+ transporter type 2B
MGGATNICSDKTGTLTQNSMTLEEIYIDDHNQRADIIRKDFLSHYLLNIFCESICINSSAFPKKDPFTGKWE